MSRDFPFLIFFIKKSPQQDVLPNKPGLAPTMHHQLQLFISQHMFLHSTITSTTLSTVLSTVLYNVHLYICFAQKRLPMASRLSMFLNHFKCSCVYQKTVVLQIEKKSHNDYKRLFVYYSSFHHGLK